MSFLLKDNKEDLFDKLEDYYIPKIILIIKNLSNITKKIG